MDMSHPENMQEDRLRPGMPADMPIVDPRYYYLDVFAIQARRIKGEWREILHFVDNHMKQSVSFRVFGFSGHALYIEERVHMLE